MQRTKFPTRIRTKFKKLKIKFVRRICPPKSKEWVDENGKAHKGLLIRHIKKARRKGYQQLVFISPESNDKTIILLKSDSINQKRKR